MGILRKFIEYFVRRSEGIELCEIYGSKFSYVCPQNCKGIKRINPERFVGLSSEDVIFEGPERLNSEWCECEYYKSSANYMVKILRDEFSKKVDKVYKLLSKR